MFGFVSDSDKKKVENREFITRDDRYLSKLLFVFVNKFEKEK